MPAPAPVGSNAAGLPLTGARQKQAKQNLVGQRGALDVARAQAEAHGRGVGGDQAQAAPARNETVLLGARDESVVERGNGGQRQLGARLRERLFGHGAQQPGLALQMAKEHIELGLNAHAHAHAGQHQRHQGRQR